LTRLWQLAEGVILRPEAFGGMAFHRERGVTLELDAEAYHFLCTFTPSRPLPPSDHPAARLAPQLVRLGFLHAADNNAAQPRLPSDTLWLGDGFTLSAPETVHLAITTRCNLSCPGCYVPYGEASPDWTVAELQELIDQWAYMSVFQLAVGGGEPLLFEHLFDVLRYARKQDIVPSLTTNGVLLNAKVVRRLEQAGVARINVSWNGPEFEDCRRGQTAIQALGFLVNSTLQVGVNLLVTRGILSRLADILTELQELGVRRVTILRPKPPPVLTEAGAAWYDANRLHQNDLLQMYTVLSRWSRALKVEVDSALVGLMGQLDPALLRWRAIHGCAAGRRICTVWPDGRVTPCSFLADLCAGDVRRTPFADLWRRGMNWKPLRDPTVTPQGSCDGCPAARQCRGSCCISRYESGKLFAGDAECPYQKNNMWSAKSTAADAPRLTHLHIR